MTCVEDGPIFGKSVFLTPRGDGNDRHAPVFSPDGKTIAYNRTTETFDKEGRCIKNYAGKDLVQIFLLKLDQSPAELFAEK